jgi:hypothetical protein
MVLRVMCFNQHLPLLALLPDFKHRFTGDMFLSLSAYMPSSVWFLNQGSATT